jgi:hypothetical protein
MVVRFTTFLFKAWCTSIQKFVAIRIQTGAQRNEIALAGPRHDVAHARAHRAARGHLSTEASPSPRTCAPRLLGVLPSRASPIVRTVPVGHAPRIAGLSAASRRTRVGLGHRTTAAYSRSHHRHHRSSPSLFKTAFHPRARHHYHSRRHDRCFSELPFFPSVSSPADTPNPSSSSHVSSSLCLWASRKPPSPATPPAAAAVTGPRRSPMAAISSPQLWPSLGPS